MMLERGLARLRDLLGRRDRARRAREVFERLESEIDSRFETADWTNEPGGDPSGELTYRVPHQEMRQLNWLSYVSGRLTEMPPGGKLLDVGSSIFWAVGVAASDRDVTVVDVRSHPLEDTLPFSFVQSSVAKLPFPDEEFDLITVPQLLHHIGLTFGQPVRAKAYLAGLDELTRVLKSDGKAILSTWIKAGRTSVGPGKPRIFGIEHLRHLLAERGLEVLDWHLVSHATFREIAEEALRDSSELPADWVLTTVCKRSTGTPSSE